MVRLIILIAILGTAYLITKVVMSLITAGRCADCNGLGYWKGTRGERNICRTCNGTGKKKNGI